MKDNNIGDFGLNWRLIEKPYIEISNVEKFLEILESEPTKTYKSPHIKINNISKEEIKNLFLKERTTMTVGELKKIMESLEDETEVLITFPDEHLSNADTVTDAYVVSGSKEIDGLYLERY